MSAPHFYPVADLGLAAAEFHTLRIAAEFDALASVALDPAYLWPTFKAAGGSLDLFELEPYRLAYVVFDQHHRDGCEACGQLIGKLWRFNRISWPVSDDLLRLFDSAYPNTENVVIKTKRLAQLVRAHDAAASRLAQARAIMSRAVAVIGESQYQTLKVEAA